MACRLSDAIILTDAWLLSIGPSGTDLSQIQMLLLMQMHLKMSPNEMTAILFRGMS